MTKWVCTVCGYVYEGEAAPAECPVCHVGADKFKKVEGDLTLAAEHEYGVYAKTVKNNPEISDEDKKYIFDQLKANFDGECSEVGILPIPHIKTRFKRQAPLTFYIIINISHPYVFRTFNIILPVISNH